MIDYGPDNSAQQGLVQKAEIDSHINDMLTTVDEAQIQQDYTYVLTTLHDEVVNVPVSRTRERIVYNSEKIESAGFLDDNMYRDYGNLILKLQSYVLRNLPDGALKILFGAE